MALRLVDCEGESRANRELAAAESHLGTDVVGRLQRYTRDENAVASKISGGNLRFDDPSAEALASQTRAVTHALLWIEISKQHDRLIDLERETMWRETGWIYRVQELGWV